MNKIILFLFFVFVFTKSFTQNLYSTDTFSYTINLDLNQNLYLKSVPIDLLKGYCRGDWNAYYPKKEMNQCLFDDFLQRYNFTQIDLASDSSFCFDSYCENSYFKDIYGQFARKLKYREVLFYDERHSTVKRELLWFQVYFSKKDNEGWKHFNGPVFWMKEINSSATGVSVINKNISSASWSLEKEFQHGWFIVNENKQEDDKKKVIKYERTEEN